MRWFFALFLTIAPGLATVSRADTSVRAVAEAYRDAVKEFERAVFRLDRAPRHFRKLADALEDQSSRVRRESRDWDDYPELIREWDRALRLHDRVEREILGDPRCPYRPELLPAWSYVQSVTANLDAQIHAIGVGAVGYRGGVPGYGYRPPFDAPPNHHGRFGPAPVYRPVVPRTPLYRTPLYDTPSPGSFAPTGSFDRPLPAVPGGASFGVPAYGLPAWPNCGIDRYNPPPVLYSGRRSISPAGALVGALLSRALD